MTARHRMGGMGSHTDDLGIHHPNTPTETAHARNAIQRAPDPAVLAEALGLTGYQGHDRDDGAAKPAWREPTP